MEGWCSSDSTQVATCSYFWLNRCYNNMDGVLWPADGNGDFYESCFSCTADHGAQPGLMSCTCLNQMQQNVSTQINLSRLLGAANRDNC